MIVLGVNPANIEAPRSAFASRITPVDQFFVRDHGALLGRPRALAIGGRSISIDDLAQLPQTTIEAVLQCAGNGRALFTPRVDGVPWRLGAMGNAEWCGVRLVDVLGEIAPDTTHIVVHGGDFSAAIPIAKALHRDTIIATQINGVALPQGHRMRLVVPGWAGNLWIKSPTKITLANAEPALDGYRDEHLRPLTKLRVKSQLASIGPGDVIAPGMHELVGVAFSGEARIAHVDISIDGEWRPAELDAHDTDYGFRMFRYAWDAKPGTARIATRATDTTGATQPIEAAWNPGGYLYNAIEVIDVEVRE